jgi:hypothetical protein
MAESAGGHLTLCSQSNFRQIMLMVNYILLFYIRKAIMYSFNYLCTFSEIKASKDLKNNKE